MPAPLTDVALCNRALAKFGGGAITTLTDATPPGPACALVYATTIDAQLSGYDWTFCKSTVALAPIVETAPDASGLLASGWRYVHALPVGRLKAPSKYLTDPRFEDRPVTRFQVQNDLVYSDCEKLWAIVQLRADEAVWPPYFVTLVVACLAAELIMPISGNAGLFDKLYDIAYGTPQEGGVGGAVGRARNIDAQNSGGSSLGLDALISGWRNG
ncbi:hypothetical protein [Methylocystis sp.]|uniref:hypothetical protein n=1 Tax=Methylocystis sp. TaxID=1911079 RepID=UPI00273665D8|nr:hypothetical protein [Methylocystis sp.]MDP3554828.1 hypothetical protein [Methylocystis sp.]